jgi:hypothetical protein
MWVDGIKAELQQIAKDVKSDLKAVNDDIKTVGADVSSLKIKIESTANNTNWIMRVGIPIVTAAAAVLWAFNSHMGTLGERIANLEGRGGSYTATEKALTESKTPEEVATNLNLLQAQIQKRTVSGAPLNQVELAQVGVTLNDVVSRYPNLSAGWNVSSTLVNLRFDRNGGTNLKNCWDTYKTHFEDKTTPPTSADYKNDIQWMGNCELTLDDGPQFRYSGFGQAYEKNLKSLPDLRLILRVHDAVVTYSGGPLIPFYLLHCNKCIFRTHVQNTPLPLGQRVIKQLLIADNADASIDGPQSGQ